MRRLLNPAFRGGHLQLSLRLTSRQTWRTLAAITAVFALGHLVTVGLALGLGYNELFGVRRLLNLNEEQSFPTFYSALLFLAAGVLLAVLAFAARRPKGTGTGDAVYWAGLAALFGFMSADEAAGIHELFTKPVAKVVEASGPLYFAWVVPYAALAIAVAVLYARFLVRLPRGTGLRLFVAGGVFIGGAVGMELIEGVMYEANGHNYRSLSMELAYLVEETMEMLAVAYFIATLLRHIELGGAPLQLTVLTPGVTGAGRPAAMPTASSTYRAPERYAASGSADSRS
jgi:hypothetical protein